ncbi:hypothetical protein AGMMS49546_24760 [Spirochaetia bacterium]|nr:hypothetical protein AGMMS49546_24760 [Spirochaetia bacterium]
MNKRFAIGAAVLLVLFALIFAGCPTDPPGPGPTKLEGTWVKGSNKLVFSRDTLALHQGNQVMTGSVVVSDTEITFIPATLALGGGTGIPWEDTPGFGSKITYTLQYSYTSSTILSINAGSSDRSEPINPLTQQPLDVVTLLQTNSPFDWQP